MINYIKADIYRNFNRLYFWGFVTFTSLLGFAFNILMKLSNPNFMISDLFFYANQFLLIPIFLVALIIDMVISEEYKNLTIKNVVSFGLSRDKIILSKIITTIILSVVAAIIILVIFLGSGLILFDGKDVLSFSIVKNFFLRLGTAVPLWIGAITVGTFITLLIRNNTISAYAYFALFTATGIIIKILAGLISDKFMIIYKYLITTNIHKLSEENLVSGDYISILIIALVYIIVFTLFCVTYFRKKEIA